MDRNESAVAKTKPNQPISLNVGNESIVLATGADGELSLPLSDAPALAKPNRQLRRRQERAERRGKRASLALPHDGHVPTEEEQAFLDRKASEQKVIDAALQIRERTGGGFWLPGDKVS